VLADLDYLETRTTEKKIVLCVTSFADLKYHRRMPSPMLTEWDEFVQYDWQNCRFVAKPAFVFDGRNGWNRIKMEAIGFCISGDRFLMMG
jgi:UDP-glucose 6-dehydrogenase